MSASETGDEAPLVQFFNSVRNSDNASAPASRTVSVNSAASRAQIASAISASAKRQALDAQRRRQLAGFEVQMIRSGRRRGRDAAMGMSARDQAEFARGGAIEQPGGQHPLVDQCDLLHLDALGVEGLRPQATHAQRIVDDADV